MIIATNEILQQCKNFGKPYVMQREWFFIENIVFYCFYKKYSAWAN